MLTFDFFKMIPTVMRKCKFVHRNVLHDSNFNETQFVKKNISKIIGNGSNVKGLNKFPDTGHTF